MKNAENFILVDNILLCSFADALIPVFAAQIRSMRAIFIMSVACHIIMGCDQLATPSRILAAVRIDLWAGNFEFITTKELSRRSLDFNAG